MNKRYSDCSSLDIKIYDNKMKRNLTSKEIEVLLNTYDEMIKQAEAIKAKMNESWLLKKFFEFFNPTC